MATETTLTSAAAWRPDSTAFAPADAVPDALILRASTVAGRIEGDAPSLRVAFVDDAAAQFVAEGAPIPEADPALSEVTVSTAKVSQLVRLSREQYAQAGTAEQLAASVRRAITRRADEAFVAQPHPASTSQVVTITGTPTGGTFTLRTITGAATAGIAYNAAASAVQTAVQALGGGYAAATVTGSAGGPYTVTTAAAAGTLYGDGSGLTGGTNPSVGVVPTGSGVAPSAGLVQIPGIVAGAAVASNLDSLTDLVAVLEANGATPTVVLIDPIGWARLRKVKTGTGAASTLLGAGTDAAEQRLLGLPVVVSSALPSATGLVVDRSAVVSAVGDVQIASDASLYFASDSVAVRATWRIGWNAVRPNRIGRFTVAA